MKQKSISEIFLKNVISFNNQDAIVYQLKIATMIFINISVNNLDINQLELHKNIYEIGLDIIDMYLNEKQINIIKEVLNLLGIIAKISSFSSFEGLLATNNNNSISTTSNENNELYNKIRNKYCNPLCVT